MDLIKKPCSEWPDSQYYGLAQHEYLGLLVPVQTEKDSDLQVTGDPCAGCETWTLNTDLKRRIDIFGDTVSAFVESWVIVRMTLCQISDYSIRLNQGL